MYSDIYQQVAVSMGMATYHTLSISIVVDSHLCQPLLIVFSSIPTCIGKYDLLIPIIFDIDFDINKHQCLPISIYFNINSHQQTINTY